MIPLRWWPVRFGFNSPPVEGYAGGGGWLLLTLGLVVAFSSGSLASIQEIARRRGDSVGTARWGALYRAATAKNSPPPGSGSRSRILEANIENLALLIRQIMARQSETRAYVIVDEISRDHPKTNKKEIRDSINGMLRHGRIIAVERGVYRLPRPEEV